MKTANIILNILGGLVVPGLGQAFGGRIILGAICFFICVCAYMFVQQFGFMIHIGLALEAGFPFMKIGDEKTAVNPKKSFGRMGRLGALRSAVCSKFTNVL